LRRSGPARPTACTAPHSGQFSDCPIIVSGDSIDAPQKLHLYRIIITLLSVSPLDSCEKPAGQFPFRRVATLRVPTQYSPVVRDFPDSLARLRRWAI